MFVTHWVSFREKMSWALSSWHGLLSGAGLAICLCALGCEPPSPPVANNSAADLPPGAVAVGGPPPAAPTPPPAEEEPFSEVAGVGVGAKGHGYGNDPITLPAATYWRAKEKIAFELAIPHALNLFKAMTIEGKGPATHEDFMRDIVQANQIELPELPEGLHYRYDPQTEQLMVESLPKNP